MNKPNHICKNPKCGVSYYFCDGCTVNKNNVWGQVGCCPECAKVYWDLVEQERNKSVVVESKNEEPFSVEPIETNVNDVDDLADEIETKIRKPRAKKSEE